MKNLLVALLLAPAILLAQDNPNYDPDYNGDGCFSIADVLGLLPLFGSCVEADTPWACGDSVLFDSYWYETVQIGDQCWFAENLRTTQYANADHIPGGLSNADWYSMAEGARSIYGGDGNSCQPLSPMIDACDSAQSLPVYGRLYNWHAVTDDRGLCPNNWDVPSATDWMDLEAYVASQGFVGTEGTALKATSGWGFLGPGTDDFGFSALPGGRRDYGGSFGNVWFRGYWWTRSMSDGDALRVTINGENDELTQSSWWNPNDGYSVRCLLASPLQGCTDSSYIEFNPSAELDDGSCLTLLAPGCTDSLYVEFDPLANVDDGSCLTLLAPGCTDSLYVEFDPLANVDDGSCLTLSPIEFACGDSTLYDNYWYETVLIGDQCWFAENLRTEHYANGDSIPTGLSEMDWISALSGAHSTAGQDSLPCHSFTNLIEGCDPTQSLALYGRLYNWYAVEDERGLCPLGWHVPTHDEYWDFAGSVNWSDASLKSESGWCCDGSGTNESGFSALPGGRRFPPGYLFIEMHGYWWASTGPGCDWLWPSWLHIVHSGLVEVGANINPSEGLSVRCLLDSE